MIVDCHTHVWERPEQLGAWARAISDRAQAAGRRTWPQADTQRHLACAEPVDISIVLGFRSHYLEAHVPNDYVARYVRQHPGQLVGFASVDPSRPAEAIREIARAQDLGMKGISISPAAQGIHPASTGAMRVYAEANRLRLPLIFHQDILTAPGAKMEYARPLLLDEPAREFPDLKLVISQMGAPWVDETVVLLGKHPNVYATIGGVLTNSWRAYTALLAAWQADVMGKLLFASNFPFNLPATCIETLYSIHQLCQGTNLPTIPREQLRRIVERDALALLGIPAASTPSTPMTPAPTTPAARPA